MKKFLTNLVFFILASGFAMAQNVTETRLSKDQSILNGRSLKVYSSDNSKYVSITHNGTNAVIDASSGVVSFPDGISASVAPTGMMTFASGSAVTAGSYQIGRDADGTNQIHFNGPTGASFEFSIQDTAEYVFDATTASFGGNVITSTATNAAGGSSNPLDITSTLGIMNGSDDYTAIDINITNANHTSTSNTVQALDISGITGDADATETAVIIGTGWDVAISAGEANITNVGDIAVDSVTGDNGTDVSYNDVNILELQQADLSAGSCTLGQLRLDTGGGTKELCYCQASNVWYCWSATTLTGPTD